MRSIYDVVAKKFGHQAATTFDKTLLELNLQNCEFLAEGSKSIAFDTGMEQVVKLHPSNLPKYQLPFVLEPVHNTQINDSISLSVFPKLKVNSFSIKSHDECLVKQEHSEIIRYLSWAHGMEYWDHLPPASNRFLIAKNIGLTENNLPYIIDAGALKIDLFALPKEQRTLQNYKEFRADSYDHTGKPDTLSKQTIELLAKININKWPEKQAELFGRHVIESPQVGRTI